VDVGGEFKKRGTRPLIPEEKVAAGKKRMSRVTWGFQGKKAILNRWEDGIPLLIAGRGKGKKALS